MAADPVDEAFASKWAAWRLERNRRGMRTLLWIVVLLYPSFAILDWLLAPRAALPWLFGTRAVVTVTTLVLFRVVRTPIFDRHPDEISSGYMLLCALGISLMTLFMGGLASPYYAGLTLAIVATGLLFVWRRVTVVTTHVAIVSSFVLLNLLHDRRFDGMHAVSNLFFLLSTAFIAALGQDVVFGSLREQVHNEQVVAQTKARLEQAHADLQQLDRFKSQFFANITHELKTPLAMILAPLELMLQGESGSFSDGQRASLQTMLRNGMKLTKMIGDLLDLSKIEESRLELHIAEHDLVPYLRDLVAQVGTLAQRKRLSLEFASDVESAVVACDLERIERVLVNLLSNATKFTPPGGHVRVRVGLADGDAGVRITVDDDGSGFPRELAERVFERFFQVDMAGTRKFGGTGIGLALARELVELHGGRIWAESDVGEGARFHVELPRASHPVQAGGDGVAAEATVDWHVRLTSRSDYRLLEVDEVTDRRVVERDADESTRAHTVLIVDDTPDVLRVIHTALRHEFRIFAAPDAAKGQELALREPPSAIITDLMMPDVDGLEFTRRLRADPRTRHIPIVMLTARDDADTRLAGLETGVNAYLTKPFSARELLTTVRSVIRHEARTADLLLAQRIDSLEAVAGGLAHLINNPLNYLKNGLAIVGQDTADLMAAARGGKLDDKRIDALDARVRKMLDVARTGIMSIADTVELMRRYSREGYARTLRPHDTWAATRDVVQLAVAAAARDVDVRTDFAGDGTVDCVPEELHHVLTNIVQNAIEAAPDDGTGRVAITGRGGPDSVELRVTDNGPGIKPEDRARIFAPFFTTKDPGKGMGMGLAIAWRVVQSLGGTISVESQVGKGAEFTVTLPRRQKPSAQHAATV